MVEVGEREGGEERGPPETEGPRDRLLHLGASALSDTELLSLLLAAGSRGASSLQRAKWLLETSGGLRALTHRDPAELADERCLGLSRAALLSAAVELGRRVQRGHDQRPTLSSPEEVFRWVEGMASFSKECFRVLALNARRRLLRDIIASSGCVDRCLVDPREALAPAVVVRATFVVLAHNHPSGNPAPSDTDLAVTQRLVDAAAVLGLRVLDHLVVATEGYTSMVAMGCMPQPRAELVGWVSSDPPRPRLTPDPESS